MESIPRVGLGTWKSPNTNEVTEAVRYAIEEAGYRHIDCAAIYMNEKAVGDAIKDVISRGVVKRSDLWITSKLWNADHAPEDVENACRKTISDLQCDYLDLYLIHNPMAFRKGDCPSLEDVKKPYPTVDIPIVDTWKAMQPLVEKGLVRHIGVSNFTIELMEKLRYAEGVTIQPYANQVECHLYMQQGALAQYLRSRGIMLTAYSPLGSMDSGITKGVNILKDPVLLEVANELNQTPAAVELKFLLELSPNIQVIPKSVTKSRIKENNQLNFELSESQMQRLIKRERCTRFANFYEFFGIDVTGDHF